jgi:hypothetical protein
MTGLFIRIERAGRFVNLEIEDLSDEELRAFAQSQPVERGWAWAITLAAWIRDHVASEPGAQP